MKPYAEKFYSGITWQRTREAYSKSRNYLCEDCLAKGNIVPGEIVHHVHPITPSNIDDPNITLSFSNLRLLCRSCHERVHRRRDQQERYTVDGYGRVTIIQ